MVTLPAHPNLDHLRRQAKDLLRAAQSGDHAAANRIHAVADRLSLTGAQLAVARSYGFASWPKLKVEVAARAADLSQQAVAFVQASVGDWTGRAARLLAENPEIAGYSFATALVLGDVARVRAEIEHHPGAATRADPVTGWTPLHAVCGSRWHYLDADRAEGLVEVARLLLDAGADPNARVGPNGRSAGWAPLRCATGAASTGVGHEAIIRLLLDRGAVVEDHDLYLVAFSRGDEHRCLRLLLERVPDVAGTAEMALAAPISTGDIDGVRLLLASGADPRRFAADDGRPAAAVYAAVAAGCPPALVELLLLHGADPAAPGPDGRSPAGLAALRGRDDLGELLASFGARANLTAGERFIGACTHADRALAERFLADDPGLVAGLSGSERAALVDAAEADNVAAVSLLLDLGIPIDTPRDDGATALHAAAYAGSTDAVTLLLERGADLETADRRWGSAPLEWAVIGSGARPTTSRKPDWVATVRVLVEAGATIAALSLSPDDPKPPSPAVARLLRSLGVAGQ